MREAHYECHSNNVCISAAQSLASIVQVRRQQHSEPDPISATYFSIAMHFHVRMFIAVVHYFEKEDKQSEAKCYLSTPEPLTYNQFVKIGANSVYEALGDEGWNFVNGKTSLATIIDHGLAENELFEFMVYTDDYDGEKGITVHYRDVSDPTWTSKVYADVKDAGFDDKKSVQMNAFRMKDLTKESKPLSENYAKRSPIGLPTWNIDNGASVLGQYYTDKKRLAHYGQHAQRIFAKAFARNYFPFYAESKQYELDDYCEPDDY